MRRCCTLFAFAMMLACSASSEESDETLPIEVRLAEGVVRGEAIADPPTRVFRGIPFAAPPTGANRWKRPQPVAPWTEPRAATAFGKRCPQPTTTGEASNNDNDEDCLN